MWTAMVRLQSWQPANVRDHANVYLPGPREYMFHRPQGIRISIFDLPSFPLLASQLLSQSS